MDLVFYGLLFDGFRVSDFVGVLLFGLVVYGCVVLVVFAMVYE